MCICVCRSPILLTDIYICKGATIRNWDQSMKDWFLSGVGVGQTTWHHHLYNHIQPVLLYTSMDIWFHRSFCGPRWPQDTYRSRPLMIHLNIYFRYCHKGWVLDQVLHRELRPYNNWMHQFTLRCRSMALNKYRCDTDITHQLQLFTNSHTHSYTTKVSGDHIILDTKSDQTKNWSNQYYKPLFDAQLYWCCCTEEVRPQHGRICCILVFYFLSHIHRFRSQQLVPRLKGLWQHDTGLWVRHHMLSATQACQRVSQKNSEKVVDPKQGNSVTWDLPPTYSKTNTPFLYTSCHFI